MEPGCIAGGEDEADHEGTSLKRVCCGICGQGTRYRFSRKQALEAPFSDSCGNCGRCSWYR
jgi:hypothetical protein